MPKLKNPATVSSEFGIDISTLQTLGVLDVLLGADTPLFIDPLLLSSSAHPEINSGAVSSYEQRFERIIKLLSKSKKENDVAWKAAKKLFSFSEVGWTCLGYSSGKYGSGFGKELSDKTLDVASQIISLGVDDIDMFMALAIFEEGIGPDRISDMTTNIILHDLITFSMRINESLKIPTKTYIVDGVNYDLVENPYTEEPLIFVPNDIVRNLPIATDWSEVQAAIKENEELRDRVSGKVGELWTNVTREKKKRLKDSALSSKKSFKDLLDMLHDIPVSSYDIALDRDGNFFWKKILKDISSEYPLSLSKYSNKNLSAAEVVSVVDIIIERFQDLVENKGLWKELWESESKPRKEKASQMLFYAIAYSYCQANDLDLIPEAESGNGPVDFKISQGFEKKVLVEIKLSNNGRLVHGYEKQLEIYKKAEDTDYGVFLIIDVGGLGDKYNRVQLARDKFMEEHGKASVVRLVDGNKKESASKRK
ncbi:hypothetical protein [Cobetia amphilecti]|uniref:hypothetical protein n=1 Tax=Cobetia amphilecti TaxID=1055104 RepID=UPI002551AC8A|nr:hypothetical protein [Cobetia amphilecti]